MLYLHPECRPGQWSTGWPTGSGYHGQTCFNKSTVTVHCTVYTHVNSIAQEQRPIKRIKLKYFIPGTRKISFLPYRFHTWCTSTIFGWMSRFEPKTLQPIFRRLRHPHFTLPQTPHYYLVSSLRNESISFFLSTGTFRFSCQFWIFQTGESYIFFFYICRSSKTNKLGIATNWVLQVIWSVRC